MFLLSGLLTNYFWINERGIEFFFDKLAQVEWLNKELTNPVYIFRLIYLYMCSV